MKEIKHKNLCFLDFKFIIPKTFHVLGPKTAILLITFLIFLAQLYHVLIPFRPEYHQVCINMAG